MEELSVKSINELSASQKAGFFALANEYLPGSSQEKMKRYSSSWELCPRVTIDHGIATIKCAYWSEYGGLYSATITVAKKGRTVEFLERESENLVKYESSIIY